MNIRRSRYTGGWFLVFKTEEEADKLAWLMSSKRRVSFYGVNNAYLLF